MDLRRFEWNRAKAEANLRKHRIGFELAARVFADPFVLIEPDRIEDGELRWQAVGTVDGFLVLVVAHTTYDEDDGDRSVEVIRIISARRADAKERRRYEHEER